jgi:hypothetical protein
VDDLSVLCSDEEASAGCEGGELVHEIEEEDLLEWVAAQLGKRVDFGYEVLVFELVASVPFYTVVKTFWDRKQV